MNPNNSRKLFSITSENIINQYKEEDREIMKYYFKVIKLKKRGLSLKKISKNLNVSESRIKGWIYENKKPRILRAIEIAGRKGWLCSSNSKEFLIILEIFAWIFGDGNLNVEHATVALFGKKNDLEIIANKISKNLDLKCKIIKSPAPHEEYANTKNYRLNIRGKGIRTFARILKDLGAPERNKIKTEFSLPKWIFKLKPKLKKRFLEVFLSNEIAVKDLQRNNQFPDISVKMRKIKNKVKNLLKFLNDISYLLNEFNIKTSGARIQTETTGNKGLKCDVIIHISQSIGNVFRLTKNFKLIYAKEKQEKFNIFKEICIRKIKMHMENIENFEKALKLKKKGFGAVEVAKILKLNKSRVHSWFYHGTKPLFIEDYKFRKRFVSN